MTKIDNFPHSGTIFALNISSILRAAVSYVVTNTSCENGGSFND
jgi:hypothetical protein